MLLALRDEQAEAPTVSVGMPVYNGERFIREALESALQQTFSDFELIIADNDFSDMTQDICREYMERDLRIKYIRHEKNYGGYWNFCFVARQATGQFFTWLSHDDVLEPQFLEWTVQYMSENPRTVIAAVDFAIIDENGIELRCDKLEETRDFFSLGNPANSFFRICISKCTPLLLRNDANKTLQVNNGACEGAQDADRMRIPYLSSFRRCRRNYSAADRFTKI